MNHFWISAFFSILALAGLAMIVIGIRMKPEDGGGAEKGGDIVLGFSSGDDQVLDLEMSTQNMEHREKETFDPQKHQPQALEGRKE